MTTTTTTTTQDIDLSTLVAGVPFSSCLYNASGPRSGTVEALKRAAASQNTGAVLSKSATLESQTGNPLPRIYHDETTGSSYNSEGLPNQGIDYYINLENIKEIMGEKQDEGAAKMEPHTKPYIVSLSGNTLKDNLAMLQRMADLSSEARSRIAAIELNLACPNIIGKPILAYDMEQLTDVLKEIHRKFGSKFRSAATTSSAAAAAKLPALGVKLPPYLDMIQLKLVADILNQYAGGMLSYITTINTMGNALAIDVSVQQPYILANSGLAGMSGRALKSHALANVHKLRQCLASSIDIVGVGGIETGEDVIAMILAGAKAVQIGTVHWKEGPVCFDRIAMETRTWLEQQGYKSISEIYNQLQPWSKERANQARLLRKDQQKQQDQHHHETGRSSMKTIHLTKAESAVQFWRLVSAILAVAVAILCADKWHSSNYPKE